MLPEGCVIGGFISKIINDVVDISKHKIKEADKNRSRKNHNIQTRIYQVIIDAINELTYNKHKGQDELYDVAETLLNGFKRENINRIGSVKNGLKILNPLIDNNTCERFIEILRCEIEKEENFDLYKEILLALLEDATKYNQSELQQIKLQLEQINEKLDKSEKDIQNQNTSIHKKIKSRTQEYADKWNANMFLNDFDKRDQRAGTNIKLSEVYLEEHLPHYIWKDNDEKEPSTDLKELLSEYINEKKDSQMLLVLGQPGIGKSTLITWITANFADRIDDILVYKFSCDLGKVEWKNNRVSNRILEELGLDYNDLNGKTLVLDGFDEVSIEKSRRRDILDCLYGDWIYNETIKKFSLIITCRENYVQRFAILKCKYITLLPWDEKQIKSFCNIFQEKTKNIISESTMEKLFENKEILGIPLILYMVLALNISIEKEGSIVDIYDKIFSLEGGIYDRCIDNKKFAESHRIGDVKNQIHQISREIAIWMFENKPDEAYIPQEEYGKICYDIMKNFINREEDLEEDFLIGNFFELKHCEGKESKQIYFVHRSIYEYFVVETIFSSVEDSMKKLTDESQEELAGNIAIYLKKGEITYTIGVYLYHKILKLFNGLSFEKKDRFYDWWEKTVAKMMDKGMFYYTDKIINYYENIISKECQCFINLIKMLNLISFTSKEKNILKEADKNKLEKYIKHCLSEGSDKCRKWKLYKELQEMLDDKLHMNRGIDLSKMYLSEMDFSGMDLQDINLSEVNLSKANLDMAYLWRVNLKRANLEETSLEQSNLSEAFLGHANLKGTNLKNANLSNASLVGANLEGVNLKGANLSGVNFTGINLNGIDMSYATLSKVNLEFTYLSKTNLRNAILSQSNLYKAILHGTNLYEATLLMASLREADLKEADLREADLQRADLTGADLTGADLRNTNLKDVHIKNTKLNATWWNELNLLNTLSILKKADFDYIIIEDQEQKKVYKNELFPDKKIIS